MNVQQLSQLLKDNAESAVRFQLPTGRLIPDHFHVTEIGRVDKNFIDCGGTRRESSSCLLQIWTADDVDHRLSAGKLAKILDLAQPILASSDLPIEVEYGAQVASQYLVSDVDASPKCLTFVLVAKQTDCLALERCGLGECGTNSGCC